MLITLNRNFWEKNNYYRHCRILNEVYSGANPELIEKWGQRDSDKNKFKEFRQGISGGSKQICI